MSGHEPRNFPHSHCNHFVGSESVANKYRTPLLKPHEPSRASTTQSSWSPSDCSPGADFGSSEFPKPRQHHGDLGPELTRFLISRRAMGSFVETLSIGLVAPTTSCFSLSTLFRILNSSRCQCRSKLLVKRFPSSFTSLFSSKEKPESNTWISALSMVWITSSAWGRDLFPFGMASDVVLLGLTTTMLPARD